MSKANKPVDVFKYIDMKGGDKTQCWPYKGTIDKGRPYITIRGKRRIAYRVAYECVHGVQLASSVPLLHSCDNSICCNVYQHLTEGTHEKNMEEMRERERHGLPSTAVRAIRKLQGKQPAVTVAELYGISERQVRYIWDRTSYRDIGDE